MLRAPPNKVTNVEALPGDKEKVCLKRNRSDSSPGSLDRQKIRRELDCLQTNIQGNENEKEVELAIMEVNIQENLETTMAALEMLNEYSENSAADDGKKIRKATFVIHKMVTMLAYKIGRVEQEKTEMAKELSLLYSSNNYKKSENLEKSETLVNPENMTKSKTYANVKSEKTRTTTLQENLSEKQQWSTPITNKRHETLIRIENVNDSKEVLKQLKKDIDINQMNGSFKNIKHLKSGAIIVESTDKKQQEKLELALKNKGHMETKIIQSSNPMFLVTGIEKGYSDKNFLEEILLNNEIETELGYSVKDKIKIVSKRQCRNINKENWILEAPPDISKWFLKKQIINFDLMKVHVEEHVNLAMCLQCSGFGHVAKHCKQKMRCARCGGEHQPKDCSSSILKCPNCTNMNIKENESHHSARDVKCPVYKRRLERFKNNQINYNSFA